jgi:hypothetical protein
MTREQKTFLARRFREAVKSQPELRRLKRLLLKIGGEDLVVASGPDQDVPRLIDFGFVMSGPVTLKEMKPNQCHRNVSKLWKAKRRNIVGIGTGYALTEDDGLWRQHSWAIQREGILETTVLREKYFGILFWSVLGDGFCECQGR